jgi:regulation of enolase protein 1 (concanavalin A-like superfamily)
MRQLLDVPLSVAVLAGTLLAVPGVAQSQTTLATGWSHGDVGSPVLSGDASQSGTVLTVDAAGVDVWGRTDQFHFVYQRVTGDGDIVARVDDISPTNEWSKAGVMIRDSLDPRAPHGYAVVSVSRGVHFQRRTSRGSTTLSTAASSNKAAPAWVRATRRGSKISAYWSSDGTNWTLIGQQAIALGAAAYFGIAVTSHHPTARTSADLTNVTITPVGLPASQQGRDIGSPAVAGQSSYVAGAYTILAGGKDIGGTADQFHFVYQSLTGDASVTARVASVVRAHSWSKAGVMIREALTAQSRHAMMVLSSGNGYAFQRRAETGGSSELTSGPAGMPPGWVRLVRTGDLFEAYQSVDGATWTRVGSDTIPMGTTVYVGLAVTSHNVSQPTTAVVDNFVVVPKESPANQPPSVSITGPAAGSRFTAPATVAITADASDPEARLSSVDFYADTTLIGRDTTAPYAISWSASTPGTYSLTAVAADADGGTTTSGAVPVSIVGANQPPSVSLTSPASGATFTAPATINLTASASDTDGTVGRVEFYSGTTLLGTDTSAPYSFSWTGVPAGSYSLTAASYDDAGAKATSATVSVTVNQANGAPSVALTAPVSGATFTAPATISIAASASDPENQLARVEFYSGTTLLNSDTTAPYSFSWANVGAGTYTLTARAIDAAGNTTTSAAMTVTVNAAAPAPPRQVVFAASSDHTTNVTSYRFDVFTAGANPATATPVASADLGKPTPDASNDITSDQATLFGNLAAGNYIATVTAIGPGGSTRSASVAFSR